MQDEMIVALYWQRDENAISETERKYGRYLTKIAHKKYLMVSPKKISRKRTLLLPMIEEISESKPPLACASLSPSIRTMTGLRAEAQCPTSKLTAKCADGLREI